MSGLFKHNQNIMATFIIRISISLQRCWKRGWKVLFFPTLAKEKKGSKITVAEMYYKSQNIFPMLVNKSFFFFFLNCWRLAVLQDSAGSVEIKSTVQLTTMARTLRACEGFIWHSCLRASVLRRPPTLSSSWRSPFFIRPLQTTQQDRLILTHWGHLLEFYWNWCFESGGLLTVFSEYMFFFSKYKQNSYNHKGSTVLTWSQDDLAYFKYLNNLMTVVKRQQLLSKV